MATTKESTKTVPKGEEPPAGADAPVTPAAAEGEPGPAAETPPKGKRSPGVKEVIPFQWKLVAENAGFVLTLFKSVERADAEDQLERILREGYYQNPRILGADEKINQTPAAKAHVAKLMTRLEQEKKKREASKAPPKSTRKTTTKTAKVTAQAKKKTAKAKKPKAKAGAKKAAKKKAAKAPKKTAKKAVKKAAKKKAAGKKASPKAAKKTAKKAPKKKAKATKKKKAAKKKR